MPGPNQLSAGETNVVTVAQGLRTGSHVLTVERSSSESSPITSIRVYNPAARPHPQSTKPMIIGVSVRSGVVDLNVSSAHRYLVQSTAKSGIGMERYLRARSRIASFPPKPAAYGGQLFSGGASGLSVFIDLLAVDCAAGSCKFYNELLLSFLLSIIRPQGAECAPLRSRLCCPFYGCEKTLLASQRQNRHSARLSN